MSTGRSEFLWNVQAEINQLTARVRRMSQEDHNTAVVNNNGQQLLDDIDELAAVLADAREKQRKALFNGGY